MINYFYLSGLIPKQQNIPYTKVNLTKFVMHSVSGWKFTKKFKRSTLKISVILGLKILILFRLIDVFETEVLVLIKVKIIKDLFSLNIYSIKTSQS